ncbi:MAG: ROK family protein [Pirellulales bacterium]
MGPTTRELPDEVVLGVDLGGTKIAAGIVTAGGQIVARRRTPTDPQLGGDEVLSRVLSLIESLMDDVKAASSRPVGVGLGVAELVDPGGAIVSEATFPWSGYDLRGAIERVAHCPVQVEADVRAAAQAESRWGAGRSLHSFVYVTIGTGISSCLMIDGRPFVGARGLTGTFASSMLSILDAKGHEVIGPPLESMAAGPALARRYAEHVPDFTGHAPEVLQLAAEGDLVAVQVVGSAGRAVGAAVAQLINTLDPERVIVGGGLGLVTGLYRESLVHACREFVWSELHRHVPIISAELGVDAGWMGAAAAVLANLAEGRS